MEIENRTREVERYLYRLGDYAERDLRKSDSPMANFNCQLNISDVGSWIIKFRTPNRVIINNVEMILISNINVHASIDFSSLGNFWATVNGNLSVDTGASSMEGNEEALQFFKSKIFSSSLEKDIESTSVKSATRAYINQSLGVEESTTSQLIWSGWMLKKKEILHGWNSRYFKVYAGRFEYFMDPNDESPRAVIPLLDAKVSLMPKEIRVKGYDMHYQLMVEPKYHEKSFRLASERGGSAGKKEIQDWQAAFDIGSKPAGAAAQRIAAARANNLLLSRDCETGVDTVVDAGVGSGDRTSLSRGIGRNGGPRAQDSAGSGNSLMSAVRRFSRSGSAGGAARLSIDAKQAVDGSGESEIGEVPMYVYLLGALGALVSVFASALYGKVQLGSSGLDAILGLLAISGGVQGAKVLYLNFATPLTSSLSHSKRHRKQSRGLPSTGVTLPSPDSSRRTAARGSATSNDYRRPPTQGHYATPIKGRSALAVSSPSTYDRGSPSQETWRERSSPS